MKNIDVHYLVYDECDHDISQLNIPKLPIGCLLPTTMGYLGELEIVGPKVNIVGIEAVKAYFDTFR
jgi:hypothetical protein